ncbi:bifunctional diaminohydroxyphosphoribosylaminopyrimidine deaminase/5-amino-6-(5-phosphoribosylamino)uracil reductase RibD [Periweissella fabalis]|uniref:Riboflavin biosynthesis protein RibD n=1 Tax=Periweissella fabalis TaxID=1070421 RepID=A0A7X6S3W2_9LACO|nr:bifunctional diaminohydroxyphosphoribosylaminopyrimidine deaminase/5-amino-6-(5-phosphoribosylamino)uracil reductase RibD [Periweissella fabalis]MCM0598426.1 bifunctional diaminohydroxyphosphoribosylaminopyrimidine deaminase/5-amino-6-(5-phosphoribosylamino)uracil reductase RibD [Periweissella fabalis]NKZ25053.1 bifunctional diaminohydroxyphosphoribosylaminopyrimidine deaminase/5-amino-6-(5-phosphoribosylamino)uracil reductase RibD [Periweissella fabalis]
MKDHEYMELAVAMAQKAEWHSWKNPRVGAVIVKGSTILAVGYHQQYGDIHAEIAAYQQVPDKQQLIGATLYVTLEPCAHTGKQPSCATQMSTWGLKRVVVGQIDPNPLVTNQGVKRLRAAGIQVDIWPLPVSETINPAFHYFYKYQLPYVTVKVAQSLNGKISGVIGESTKITSAMVDEDSHTLRAYQQAIIIGSTTALVDQPNLTVRHVSTQHQPLRVIIDRRGRLKNTSEATRKNTLIITENPEFAKQAAHIEYLDVVTPHKVLQLLGQRGIQATLVEGGSELQAAFITDNAYQEIIIYQAMTVLPKTGLSSFGTTKSLNTLGIISNVNVIDNTLKITLKGVQE